MPSVRRRRKKMKNKVTVYIVIAALLVVCIAAVFGIKSILYKNTDETIVEETIQPEEEVVTDLEIEDVVIPEEIEVKPENVAVNTNEQTIQETPEKPEAPEKTPELKDEDDITNPDKEPEYKNEGSETEDDPKGPKEHTTPDDNTGHEGEIYVEGFGWIKDDGPGSQSIPAQDMYLSGEKIGDM